MKSRLFFYLCLSLGWSLTVAAADKPAGRFARFNGLAQAGMEIEMDQTMFLQILPHFELRDPTMREKYRSLSPTQLLAMLLEERFIHLGDLQVKESTPAQLKELLKKFELTQDLPSRQDKVSVIEFRHIVPEQDLDQYQRDVESFCRFVAGPDPVAQEKLISRLSDAHSRVNEEPHFNYHAHSSTIELSNQKERTRGLQMLTLLDFLDRPDLDGETYAFKSRNSAYSENIWNKGLWRLVWLNRAEERKRMIPAADSLERTLHYQTMEQAPAERALREEITRRLGPQQMSQLTKHPYGEQIPALLDMINYVSIDKDLADKVAQQLTSEHLKAITRRLISFQEIAAEPLGYFYEFITNHPALRKLAEQTIQSGKSESLLAELQNRLRENFRAVLHESPAPLGMVRFIEKQLSLPQVQHLFSEPEITYFKKILNQRINKRIAQGLGHTFYAQTYLTLLDLPGWLDSSTTQKFREEWFRTISTFNTLHSANVVQPLMLNILTDPRALRALNDRELQLITHNFLAQSDLGADDLQLFYHNVLAQPRYDSERLRGYRNAGLIPQPETRNLALAHIAHRIATSLGPCPLFDLFEK